MSNWQAPEPRKRNLSPIGTLFAIGALMVIGWVVYAQFFEESVRDRARKDAQQRLATLELASTGREVRISIEGTAGMEYSGAILAGGVSETVSGTVPDTYTVTGSIVSAAIQKQERNGGMTVRLSCGKSGTTTAAYGVVSVVC